MARHLGLVKLKYNNVLFAESYKLTCNITVSPAHCCISSQISPAFCTSRNTV